MEKAAMKTPITVDVEVPHGYYSIDEFLRESGLRRARPEHIESTAIMRAHVRAWAPAYDWEGEIITIINDLERLIARYER